MTMKINVKISWRVLVSIFIKMKEKCSFKILQTFDGHMHTMKVCFLFVGKPSIVSGDWVNSSHLSRDQVLLMKRWHPSMILFPDRR